MNQKEILEGLTSKLSRYFAVSPEEATKEQVYKATVLSVRDILAQKNKIFNTEIKKKHLKRVYYLCMEFLVGRSLKNDLCNLGLADDYREALKTLGFSLDDI